MFELKAWSADRISGGFFFKMFESIMIGRDLKLSAYTVLVKIKRHFPYFSMSSCKISWRNPEGSSLAFHHEINRFCLYISFFSSFSPGNFLFEIINLTLRQFLHETRNMCFLSLQALYMTNR